MSTSRQPLGIDDAIFALAFIVTIVGGLILAVTFVATILDLVVNVGWLLFGMGLVLAFALGFREGRREGSSPLRSLGRGLRQLWSWLWAFMP